VKILLLHNYYLQPGGEDAVFANEAGLLEARGHTVIRFQLRNEQLVQLPVGEMAVNTLWNSQAYRAVAALIREHEIEVCHCHNTFPLMSPAVYYAAHHASVPVIQTLHNYRLACPAAVFYRDGNVCEECLPSLAPWRAVWHKCYRGSRAASAVASAMLVAHRLAGTWERVVDTYIALTPFCKDKLSQAGIPEERIVVKPNFLVADPGPGQGAGGYALFAGRLTEEKGIRTLLQAWRALSGRVPLKIAGSGPLASEAAAAASQDPRIQYLGAVPSAGMAKLLSEASCVIFPSEWYEAGPLIIIEALANGTPVIAADLGSTAQMVKHGVAGLLYPAGNSTVLAATVDTAWQNPDVLRSLRASARAEFESEYTAERNYEQLTGIYARAMTKRDKRGGTLRQGKVAA
jgi:glycosyltransferase involved in cell wall biosynthesis